MKRARSFTVSCVIVSSLLFAACGTQAPEPATEPAPAGGPEQRPYANLAQMMRAIPFPNSNLIFDAGSEDPEERKKAAEGGAGGGGGATANFGNVYAGWQQVENAALALQETANLLLIPGRMCENGKPAPTDREDYRRFVAQLADAGAAAYKAAQSKNVDMMLEVGGTVTEACSACHEVYRDAENNADRCTPPAAE